MTTYQDDTDFFENFEMDEAEEATPFRSGRMFGRPMGAALSGLARGSSMPRRSSEKPVTEAMLNMAVSKLDSKIEGVHNNSKKLEVRTNTLANEQDRQGAAMRKESSERKKEAEAIKRDLKQTRELSAILPMLSQPSTVTVNDSGGNPVKVISGNSNSLSTLLPLMLMMGSGSSDSGSSSGFGGGDNSMMMMMAVLLSANK